MLSDHDLSGVIAVVTGGYSGIGLETTRALAAKGARVIVPVRSPEKAAARLAELEGTVQTAPLALAALGLGALALGAWREAPDEGYLAYATFRDSKGLRPGAEVRLSGQQIGHVEDVRLDPGSLRAEMTLRLDPAYGLPDSSLARLDRDGFLDPWHVAVDLIR